MTGVRLLTREEKFALIRKFGPVIKGWRPRPARSIDELPYGLGTASVRLTHATAGLPVTTEEVEEICPSEPLTAVGAAAYSGPA